MAWYRLGTVTVTNGSATVTGVGTLFTSSVRETVDPRTGYEKALQIYDALHGFGGDRFVAGGHWVIKCEGIQSEPVYLGQDENGR